MHVDTISCMCGWEKHTPVGLEAKMCYVISLPMGIVQHCGCPRCTFVEGSPPMPACSNGNTSLYDNSLTVYLVSVQKKTN